jgi:hypothetical protein
MDTIVVEKSDLIERLKQNRDEHRAIFERAQSVYREKVIEELDRALDDAKNGRKILRFLNLPEPEDHTREFDTAIQMLEWDTSGTVELTRRDFARYVQNEWEWRASFSANTESYSAMLDREEN